MVYFITGPQGAGKTVLAYKMQHDLLTKGIPVLILDGDEVREYFPTGFSDDERAAHIDRMARIAAIAEAQGLVVIIAAIAPKKIWRMAALKLFKVSKLIYLADGVLWTGTTYEIPDEEELNYKGGI